MTDAKHKAPAEAGVQETLRVLLDNLVIAQSLSKELRQRAADEARSYLSALRAQPPAREDALRAKGEELAKALKRYGFPVSGAATVNLGAFGSSEAMAVDFATREFTEALAALQAEQKGSA